MLEDKEDGEAVKGNKGVLKDNEDTLKDNK